MELLEEVCGQRSSEHQALEDNISKAAARKEELFSISKCELQIIVLFTTEDEDYNRDKRTYTSSESIIPRLKRL